MANSSAEQRGDKGPRFDRSSTRSRSRRGKFPYLVVSAEAAMIKPSFGATLPVPLAQSPSARNHFAGREGVRNCRLVELAPLSQSHSSIIKRARHLAHIETHNVACIMQRDYRSLNACNSIGSKRVIIRKRASIRQHVYSCHRAYR